MAVQASLDCFRSWPSDRCKARCPGKVSWPLPAAGHPIANLVLAFGPPNRRDDSERPTKQTAITRAELEAMLATCDESLEGLRDRALLCFGFASAGRRRSEIAAADIPSGPANKPAYNRSCA